MIRNGIDYSYCWLQLELTDYCNLNCKMCLSGNSRELLNIDTPHLIWNDTKTHKTKFEFHTNLKFDNVYLVGEFNYWGILEDPENLSKPTVKNTEMEFCTDKWVKEIKLKTGKYRFAFLGQCGENFYWMNDDKYKLARDKIGELEVSYIEIGNPGKLKRGFMDIALVKKIILEMVEKKIHFNEITPFWFGESTMHPNFLEILKFICENNKINKTFNKLGIHTNGHFLTAKITDELLKSAKNFDGGLKISFSLDAVNSETYKKIRGSDNFELCTKNVKKFLKRAVNIENVLSIVQFIVQDDNFSEAKDFYNYWTFFFEKEKIPYKFYSDFSYDSEESGKTILFLRPLDSTKNMRTEENNLHNLAVKDFISQKNKKSKQNNNFPDKYVCSSPWHSIFVQWNGEVTVCCADTLMNLKIGDFNFDNFDKIWHRGSEITELRKNHLENRFDEKFLRCRYCPQWQMPGLNNREIELYGKWLGTVNK